MSPIRRSIPPLLDDPRATGLTITQRHTLTLLPLALDDHGRGLDDPGRINGLLYGPLWREHGPEALDADLAVLETAGFVTRYELAGVRFLQMLDWDEQQVLSRKAPSRFPAPPGGTRSAHRASPASDKIKASVDELVDAVSVAAGKLQDPVVQEKAVSFIADLAKQVDPRLADKVRAKGGQWVASASAKHSGTAAAPQAGGTTTEGAVVDVQDDVPARPAEPGGDATSQI
ncbi:MAG: hypothetical protein U0Q15_09415 [Kineosporiaceae bacterium]